MNERLNVGTMMLRDIHEKSQRFSWESLLDLYVRNCWPLSLTKIFEVIHECRPITFSVEENQLIAIWWDFHEWRNVIRYLAHPNMKPVNVNPNQRNIFKPFLITLKNVT